MTLLGRGSLLGRKGLVVSMADGDDAGGGGGSDNGGGTENWQDSLPEPVREWDEVKNSDSSDKFWDQVTNMRSHLGTSIRIPSSDAGEEDLATFRSKLKEKVPSLMETPDFENEESLNDLYDRMGRPESPDAYEYPEIVDDNGKVIEGIDHSLTDALKPIAHKYGLSNDKFQKVVKEITSINLNKHAEMMDKLRTGHDELAKEWGTAGERNFKIIHNFLDKANAPEHVVNAIKGGMMDAKTTKWFYDIASTAFGKNTEFHKDVNNTTEMTKEEATTKISEIRNNPKHPYNNPKDPAHVIARKRMRELYLIKNPSTGTAPAPGSQFNVGGF